MAYGQKNYLQLQGRHNPANGKDPIYRIDQIGCLLTTFSNWLERRGRGIDPVYLNAICRDRAIYIDVDDGVLDDLGWQSITALDPMTAVSRIGTNSWPSTNDSAVGFRYKSLHTGQLIEHFCLVVDAANHVILDSYDGIVKAPAQYEGVYGSPIKFAEFIDNTPLPVEATTVDSHPTGQDVSGKKLFLPAAAGLWRVYPLNAVPRIGNEVGKLAPGNPQFAPGLTYDILATTQWANVYKIHTETWGDVTIYAGPDTIAQFVDEAPAALTPSPVAAPVVPDPADLAPAPIVEPSVSTAPIEPTIAAQTVASIDTSWQVGIKNVADYQAIQDYVVTDLATGADYADLLKGQTVHAAERFTKDGVDFVRTQKAVDSKRWPGVPLGALKLIKAIDIAEPDEDDIFKGIQLDEFAEKLDASLKKVNTKGFREKIVKVVGQLMLFFTKKKNKKG